MIAPYSSYKDSGVRWIGDVPSDWNVVAIKRLTSVQRGASPRPIDDPKYFDESGEYLWTRISDVSASDGFLKDSKEHLSALGASLSVKLQPGSLFLSIAGTVGKPCINKVKACIHDGFVYFPNLRLNPIYLKYIFDSGEPYKGLGKMGTQLNLNTETVGSIYIPIPSESEIQAIIKFLNFETTRIDALITEKQRFIDLLKEKRQALISHYVTKGLDPTVPMKDSGVEWIGEIPEHWVVKSYRYACKVYRGKFGHRPRNDPDFYDGEYPFIQTGDVARASKFIESYSQTLNEKGKSVSQEFPSGTLMMAIAANVGDTAILSFNAYAPDSVVGFKPLQSLDVDFLRYSFMAAFPALQQASTQSAQANLNVERISSLKASFPPLEEQKKIVAQIADFEAKAELLINETLTSITLLKEHRTALISAAVTGKIDVRDLAASPTATP